MWPGPVRAFAENIAGGKGQTNGAAIGARDAAQTGYAEQRASESRCACVCVTHAKEVLLLLGVT